jgi:predicted transcriptional regulator
MPETEMSQIVNPGIELDALLYERLKALSGIKEHDLHWLVQTAIAEYVEREEKYEREKREDMERWERYQLTGHGIPGEVVEKWLASWGTESELPCPK